MIFPQPKRNTLEAWNVFLKKHPHGRKTNLAKGAHDEFLIKQANASLANPQALEAIFKQCKTSIVADKVFNMWDEASWNEAKGKNTVSSYRSYLLLFPTGKHLKDGKVNIEELIFRDCEKSGKIELYEQYLKEYPTGKYTKEARENLANLAYQIAKEKDTIEGYEDFLKINSGHKIAGKRLRQLRYERAVKTGTLDDWLSFYDKHRHLGWTDDSKDVEQMREHAAKEIERLLYEKVIGSPSLELCRDYLKRYPQGAHKQQVTIKMEPLLFDDAVKKNSIDPYQEYLKTYPNGVYVKDVQTKLEPLLFKKAQEEDWYSKYEDYLKKYPDGSNAPKAKERLAYLKVHKAIAEIDYPKVIEQGNSPYFNVSSPFWSFDTVFREKSGSIGFKVRGSAHIDDPSGGRWGHYGGSIGRGEVKVSAGSTGKDSYWCSSSDHVLCNGYWVCTWTGEDAGGHAINFDVKVKLQHTNCPGPKKK
jgi:hypothetical protein